MNPLKVLVAELERLQCICGDSAGALPGIVIPTEHDERAFTRGPMTEQSEEMGNVRASSDRGICSAQGRGSTKPPIANFPESRCEQKQFCHSYQGMPLTCKTPSLFHPASQSRGSGFSPCRHQDTENTLSLCHPERSPSVARAESTCPGAPWKDPDNFFCATPRQGILTRNFSISSRKRMVVA